MTRKKKKPILCLDFDGVIHSYSSGWLGDNNIPDPPVEGAFEFILMASTLFRIFIFSTRSVTVLGREAMEEWFIEGRDAWMKRNGLNPGEYPEVIFPDHKPPALITIDDRVLRFDGEWPDIINLRKFKPWTEQEKENA